MSFARNFEAGMRIAGDALDTYEAARQKRDLGRIMEEKVQELAPVDEVNLNAAPEPTVNADGTTTAPTLGIQPVSKKQYQFLGKTYDSELTPDQLDNARYRAAADVIGKGDPIRGLQMRQSIKKSEQDDWRFDEEKKDSPLKRKKLQAEANSFERADRRESDAEKLADEERAFTTQFTQAYQNRNKSPEHMQAWEELAGPYVQAIHAYNGVPNKYAFDPKTGDVIGIPDKGGKAFTVDPVAALPMVMQMRRLSSQFGGDPMKAAEAINAMTDKERERFLAQDQRNFERAVKSSQLGAEWFKAQSTDRYHQGMLGATREHYGAQRKAGTPLGLSDDGTKLLLNTPQGLVATNVPEGFKGLFPKITGEKVPVETKVHSGGIIQKGDQFFAPDAMDPSKYKQVSGLAPSALDRAIAAKHSGQQSAARDGRPSMMTPENFRPASARPDWMNIDPANLERRSSRGLFGGLSYGYYDPTTDTTLSTEQYNQLLGAR